MKKIIAAGAAFSLITSFTASAAGSFFTEKQLGSQSDFLLGADSPEEVYDFNCDDKINVFDYLMMKRISSSENTRYSSNIFDSADVEKDIVYAQKTDYQQNDISLNLDLYQPENDGLEKRPVIIWVHGGGMYTGSKDSYWDPVTELAPEFAQKGYVSISIDYRLNPEWESTGAFNETMKNAAEDVASAVEWVRENADVYRLNPNYIALAGYSSGAEIVDNMYYSNSLVNETEFDKSGIKAVVSISGNRLFFDTSACSGNSHTNCLILHGDADDINPVSDAQTFLTQLGDRGVMETLSGNNHYWVETDEQKDFLKNNISEFLIKNMFTLYSDSENVYNFAKGLQYSLYFYDAEMCGTEVDELTDIPWRSDCHLQDCVYPLSKTNLTAEFISNNQKVLDPDGDGCIDVSGGFHDAGDHVKMGLPESQSASVLGWGYYEFSDSFEKTGQTSHFMSLMRYFCQYFMKCTFMDENGDTDRKSVV